MKIDHINISAPGELIDRVRDFYCELFGMHVGPRPRFDNEGMWLYHGDKDMIHLTRVESRTGTTDSGYLDHVAIRLSGIDRFMEKLVAMNIEYGQVRLEDVDTTQLFFRDPAGIKIEASFVGESPD